MKRIYILALLVVLAVGHCMAQNIKAHSSVSSGGYRYWLYTPDDYDRNQPTPVILFLHGRSLCGNDLNKVLRYGTLDAINKGLTLPSLVLAPQNPGEAWNPRKLMDIIEWTEENYNVDKSRIYVLGMSLGGYGTMDMAGTYPDKIAAAMALCGGCYLKDMKGLGELPFWILHGTADRAVGISESKKVVSYLQGIGLTEQLRYDWLPGASHGALARAFYLKDTYDWLFAHTLKDPGRPVERLITIDNDILKQAYSELRELRALVDEGD